jgi:hypothetical protein
VGRRGGVEPAAADVDMKCDERMHGEAWTRRCSRRDGGGMVYDGTSYEDFGSVDDMICDVVTTALDDDRQLGQPPPQTNLQHHLHQSGVLSAPSAGLSSLGPDARLQRLQSMGSSVSDLFAMHAHRLQDAGSFTMIDFDTVLADPRARRGGSGFPTQHNQHHHQQHHHHHHHQQQKQQGRCILQAQAPAQAPRVLQDRSPDTPLPAAASVVLRTSKGREILGPSWNSTSPVPTDRRVLLAGPTCLLPSAADIMTILNDMVGLRNDDPVQSDPHGLKMGFNSPHNKRTK